MKNREARARELSSPDRPNDQQIAVRAYEIYIARGAAPGGNLDDWLQAERECQFSILPRIGSCQQAPVVSINGL